MVVKWLALSPHSKKVPGSDPFGVTDENHAFVGKVNCKCHSENYSENFLKCKYGDELLFDLYVGSAVSWRWTQEVLQLIDLAAIMFTSKNSKLFFI